MPTQSGVNNMTIGIDWDEEEAAQQAPTVQKKTVQEPIGQGVSPLLKDTTPSSAVGLASVPPSVSTPVATGNPMVNQTAQAGGSMLQSLIPLINPIHLKQGVSEYVDSSSLDPYATAAHIGADVLGGYLGLKTVQGIGSGISKKIGNVIGGVDPTIQAQINQSNKQAERAARAPQGKTPDPLPTAGGRIEPTLSIEPPPPPAPPTTPPPPVTPVEKAAAAVENPMDAVKLREATAKADLAELELTSARQATPDFEAKRLQAANAAQQSMKPVVPSTEVTPTFESRRQQALQAARQSMGDFPASVPPASVPPSAVTQVKTLTVPEVTPEIAPEASTPKPIQRSAPPVSLQDSTGRQMPGAVSSAAAPKTVVTGEAGASVAPTEAAVTEAKTRAARRSPEQMKIDKAAAPELGGKNWLTSQLGGEANYKSYIEQYNQGKPYANATEAQKSIEANLGGPKKSEYHKAKQGIVTAAEKEVGPIKPNKKALEYFDKHGKLKGGVTPGMMFNIAGNALGAASLMNEYKQAKKTGDWSNFGLSATGQIIGNVAPKLALPFALMQPGSAGESQDELQALGKRLQAAKFGAGRGKQGVPPPLR
jgi:hypothetical protein